MAAITLLSGINESGFYAQYATSAEKDKLGRDITATYLTAVPAEYPTTTAVAESIATALAGLSSTIDASAFATETYVQEEIAKVGSFTTANGTGEDLHPAVQDPSTKTIYLVKDTTATGNDKWKEWIVTGTETTGWELIGDTTMDLSNYATTSFVNTNYVSIADNQTLSSNVATMAAASGDWNKVSDKLDSTAAANTYLTQTDAASTYALKTEIPTTVAELTDSGNYYLKTETSGSTELTNAFAAKQDTLTFSYATVGE